MLILNQNARAPIQALKVVVEANERYVDLTGRAQDVVALSVDHARALLELLLTAYDHEKRLTVVEDDANLR